VIHPLSHAGLGDLYWYINHQNSKLSLQSLCLFAACGASYDAYPNICLSRLRNIPLWLYRGSLFRDFGPEISLKYRERGQGIYIPQLMNTSTFQPAILATSSTSVTPIVIAGVIAVLAWRWRFWRSPNPLPPGPPGLPIIGNALQLPLERQWVTFTDWAKTYGMHCTSPLHHSLTPIR
jgi:hypothetical protein